LHRFRKFPKVALQLFRKKTILFQSLGVSVESLIVGGLSVFWPKYVENQFGIEPTLTAIYFGKLTYLGN